jgi:hypothetical protein
MTSKAKAAFDVYLEMGAKRTLVKLAELTGHAKSTIEGWSSRYEWTRRVKEHDHAHLREQLGQREIVREHSLQRLVDISPEAVEVVYRIMTDDTKLPILNRQGEHATDKKGNLLWKPGVRASTKLEAAKTALGIAGLVPVRRMEHVDRSGEQLDAAANVLRAMTPRQIDRLIESLDEDDNAAAD